MRRAAVTITALLALAGPVPASEQSDALSARALVELKRGNDAAALELFDRAVAADPRDAIALYHRGVARSQLGQANAAIADLEAALAIRPDFDEAALELGSALLASGEVAKARPRLEQARRNADVAAQAEFLLAVAALREERYEEARAGFERARTADPTLSTAASYYLGVADYRAGHTASARARFAAVAEQSPESDLGREAAAFVAAIDGADGSGATVYAGLSLQYDSNVVLAPAGGLGDPAISDESDGRVALSAGGAYQLYRGDRSKVSVGYDFYQDFHFELTDFNVQNHRPSLVAIHDFGLLQGAFATQYDFYLLDDANWLHSVTASPMLVWPQRDFGRLEAYIRFQWREYTQSRFEILNGYNTAGGLRQVIGLGAPGRLLWGSFEVDSQDSNATNGELYEYTGIQTELLLSWLLPWAVTSEIGYRFRYENYADASAAFVPAGAERRDDEHRLGAVLRRDLTEMLSLVAAWVGTWNESNKDDFEYDRHIVSLGVELRY